MFANNGYEFCGIDQQGFGHSGGIRGRIEGVEASISDINNFSQKYMEKYGDSDTKLFLMGNSLGGLISSFVAAGALGGESIAGDTDNRYNGVCLSVPYFGLYDEQILNKVRPMLEMWYKVSPNKSINFGGRS